MSDHISPGEQPLGHVFKAQTAEPSQAEWSEFGQGVSQLCCNNMHHLYNATVSEANIIRRLSRLEREVQVGEALRQVKLGVRPFEFCGADWFVLVVDKSAAQNMPAADASHYELWKWARKHPAGVQYLPVDMKQGCLSIGNQVDDRHKHFYHWSTHGVRDGCREHAEVIIEQVQGVPDYLAIIPTHIWQKCTEGTYGAETISGPIPAWMSIFMVHHDDLHRAVIALSDAAAEGKPYVNPTNGRHFDGWIPRLHSNPSLDSTPGNPGRETSLRSTLELFDEIEHSGLGCAIELNPDAPLVHDFYLQIAQLGLFRVEFKEGATLSALEYAWLAEPRRNPFSERCGWHVLYLKIAGEGGVHCITRDEIADKGYPGEKFMREHRFSGFEAALAHIKAHASAAKREAQRAMLVTPAIIAEGLPRSEIVLSAGLDPLTGHLNQQLLLPWLAHLINTQCMQRRYGAVFSLGHGHRVATHLFVEHFWTSEEEHAFSHFGQLPVQLWHAKVQNRKCLALRLQQHTPEDIVSSQRMPYVCKRGHWKKPVKGFRHFFIIGSVLPHELHRKGDRRNAWYLLLPSHFTSLSSDKDLLPPPTFSQKEKGQHFFDACSNTKTELKDPKWPNNKGCIVMNANVITDADVNVHRYLLNLVDGVICEQLRTCLQGEGEMRIENPEFPGENKVFDRASYHLRVGDVQQATWDYGYERSYRTHTKGKVRPDGSRDFED